MTATIEYFMRIITPDNYFSDFLEFKYRKDYEFINLFRTAANDRIDRLKKCKNPHNTIVLGPIPTSPNVVFRFKQCIVDDISELKYIDNRIEEDIKRLQLIYSNKPDEFTNLYNQDLNITITKQYYSDIYKELMNSAIDTGKDIHDRGNDPINTTERHKTLSQDDIEDYITQTVETAAVSQLPPIATNEMLSLDKNLVLFDKKYHKTIRVFAHITGTPGAGKSFLGERLADRFIVKDIDDFIGNTGMLATRSSLLDRIEYENGDNKEKFFINISEKIYKWVEDTKYRSNLPIILVGLSYFLTENEIFMLPIETRWRFCIDIPFDKLLHQYIKRDVEYLCMNKEKAARDIENGLYDDRWDQQTIKKCHEITDFLYKMHNYSFMSQKDIETDLVKISDLTRQLSCDFYKKYAIV